LEISLSTSAFNDAARCLKRYEYRWVEGLVPPPKDVRPVLRRGVWVHRALELIDQGLPWTEELDRLEQWALYHEVDANQVMAMRQEVDELVQDYVRFWDSHDDELGPWKTTDTEVHLTWEPRAGITLSATIDKLATDKRGRTWIWERKTTQDIPDSDWRTVDPQTMLQYMIARENGIPVSGVLFDYVLTRPSPSLRVKKNGELYAGDDEKAVRVRHIPVEEMYAKGASAEYVAYVLTRCAADAQWFQRYPTFRPDDNVSLTIKDVVEMIRRIWEAETRGYYARSINLLDCRLFCPYGRLCMREYQLGRPSPALREEYTIKDSPEVYAMGRSEL
jgi:PD-(D/E)XK nuclease superfamily